jgi:hypothetical protein
MGRDDIVVWPVVSANQLTSPSVVTRCLIHCKRDGKQDVIIDSADVPDAFVFDEQATVRGKLVDAVKWMPGLAVGEQFTETAKWKCQVFLFDAVHTSGVDHGAFWLDVAFAGLPVAGGAVMYVPGSKDVFSPTAATSMTLTLVNSDVDEGTYPDAVVVLSLNVHSTSTAGTIVAPTSVTIGGVAASLLWKKGTVGAFTGQTHAVVAMARVPVGGFTSSGIVVTWGSLITSGAVVRGSTNAFYNVDVTSDGFALGHSEVDNVGVTGSLTVPDGGAVFADNIQYTGGDFDANVYTDGGAIYTMQTPDVSMQNGHYYMTGYKLFATGASEVASPNALNDDKFRPGIVFVMAGTA